MSAGWAAALGLVLFIFGLPNPSPFPTHTNISNQQLYFVNDPAGWKWPIGQSMIRGDTLLVAFRGTM